MSNHPTPEEPKDFDAPPPPPAESFDEEQDVGLATEMVFSGKRRQELRDSAAYETLQPGEVPSEDDEDIYDDIEADDDADEEHSTELLVTENHSDLREAVQQAAQDSPPTATSSEQPPQDFGNYKTVSFDPNQHYSQQTGTTNEPMAITMLIVLSVVALGIFGVLGLLIYRLFTGA